MQTATVPYDYLDRPDEVAAFLASLPPLSSLALDLEADSLHSYREKTCLIQLSAAARNVILDPLFAGDGLAGLGALLSDPSIEKVLHGADYDVRLLKKDFGFEPRGLFDTMIAAQLSGREHVGLAALLEENFGVVLQKKYQRADWSRRPLPPELLAYAALDTAHLLALKEKLEAELRQLGRLDWAREEFRLLEGALPAPVRPPNCLDVKGAGRLPPRSLALLQRLLEARDELARTWDRPPFRVVGTEVLLRWAEKPPATRRDVFETPGAAKPALAQLAPHVLDAVKTVRSLSLEECPRPRTSEYVAMTGAEERRLKRLKKARAETAEALRLQPGLLVNSATLERLARMPPAKAAEELPRALKNWQLGAAGDALHAALEPHPG